MYNCTSLDSNINYYSKYTTIAFCHNSYFQYIQSLKLLLEKSETVIFRFFCS